jgi:hypothetical protein
MRSSKDGVNLHACESIVIDRYDEDFAALYPSVWDSYLGDRQEEVLNELFHGASCPNTILDAAAGTGDP